MDFVVGFIDINQRRPFVVNYAMINLIWQPEEAHVLEIRGVTGKIRVTQRYAAIVRHGGE